MSLQDTPYEYLLKYRLAKAAELLLNTRFSIGEIAEAAGFHSQSHFHFGKLFRQRTGYSPKKYRGANEKTS